MSEREGIAAGLCCFVAGSIDQKVGLSWDWTMRSSMPICTTQWSDGGLSVHDERGFQRMVTRG